MASKKNNQYQPLEERLLIASHIDNPNSKQELEYEGEEGMAEHLQEKFDEMTKQINDMPKNPELFKNHQLPLARIKKIMKSDEDVRVNLQIMQMISSETPVLFAKACQIFIIQLTYRAWSFTEEAKRRTLQKSDIASCIQKTEIFDFLIDLIPKQEQRQVKKMEGAPGEDGIQWSLIKHQKFK